MQGSSGAGGLQRLRALIQQHSSSADAEDLAAPLSAVFTCCQAIHSQQDELIASRDAELLTAALQVLLKAEAAVSAASLFSSNEDAEDLATADLKYLLLPHYRAQLLASFPAQAVPSTRDPGSGASGPPPLLAESRVQAVLASQRASEAFLARCEQYGLLGSLASSVLRAIEVSGGAIDPGTKRTMKIEKFKREKAINAAVSALQAQRGRAAAGEEDGTSAGAAAAAGSSSGGGAAAPAADEESERQLWLLAIEQACLQALDTAAALQQEEALLRNAIARQAEKAEGPPGQQQQQQRRAEAARAQAQQAEVMRLLQGMLRDLDGSKRESTKANVFKPGHTMPTLTVEQAGEIEMRLAQEREAAQGRREAAERARRAALDSDEEDSEDKAQQRAWDDYRDANPRGAGNSKLRPCG